MSAHQDVKFSGASASGGARGLFGPILLYMRGLGKHGSAVVGFGAVTTLLLGCSTVAPGDPLDPQPYNASVNNAFSSAGLDWVAVLEDDSYMQLDGLNRPERWVSRVAGTVTVPISGLPVSEQTLA